MFPIIIKCIDFVLIINEEISIISYVNLNLIGTDGGSLVLGSIDPLYSLTHCSDKMKKYVSFLSFRGESCFR